MVQRIGVVPDVKEGLPDAPVLKNILQGQAVFARCCAESCGTQCMYINQVHVILRALIYLKDGYAAASAEIDTLEVQIQDRLL